MDQQKKNTSSLEIGGYKAWDGLSAAISLDALGHSGSYWSPLTNRFKEGWLGGTRDRAMTSGLGDRVESALPELAFMRCSCLRALFS